MAQHDGTPLDMTLRHGHGRVRPAVQRLLVLLVVGAVVGATAVFIQEARRLDTAVHDALDTTRALAQSLSRDDVPAVALTGENVADRLRAAAAAGGFESVAMRTGDGRDLAAAGAGMASLDDLQMVLDARRDRAAVVRVGDRNVVHALVSITPRDEDGTGGLVLETVSSVADVAAADRAGRRVAGAAILVGAVTAAAAVSFVERRRDRRMREQRRSLDGILAREAAAYGESGDLQRLKSDFLTGVSHGLRTTLHVLAGTAQTLSRHGDRLTGEQRAQLSERLEAQSHHLDDLVHDLLDIESLAEGRPARARTESLVSDVVNAVRDATELGDRRLDLEVEGVVARLAPAHLERILLHLVRNAVAHSPDGSTITVTAVRDEKGVELAVADEGPGIPVAERQRVFDPLVRGAGGQADPSPGLGLGLAVVRRLTHLYGGRTWVADAVGGGAIVHVQIPDVAGRVGVDAFTVAATLDVDGR